MIIKWNFPNNGCGQVRGIADAGIETFTGTEIQSLAREICQNSLDAAIEDSSAEVKVEFERYKINSIDIPGYVEFSQNIEKAKEYWGTKRSEKTINYLKKAHQAINNSTSYVLRISDYNTIGLNDPYGDSDEGWNALTKLDGGATKSGDKAGAFGIGKNAPFCNSDYRLVFYRTLNGNKEIAAQGMARFISFPDDLTDTIHTMTTGIGYYGNVDGNLPIDSIEELDNLKKRDEAGTDVFVFGFNGGYQWEKEVICEILENFLMSINRNLLSVTVGENTINKSTLEGYIGRYQKDIKNAYWFHQVLTRPETKEYVRDFHEIGQLRLRVLVDPSEKLNRKILITRSSGMKLFDLGNISRLISFSGILEMEGKELNEFFREMETPAHDKWLPSRHSSNPTLAKEYYGELKDWVREIIQNLGEHSSDEEIEVEGLTGVLQKESENSSQNGDDKKESLHDTIGEILIQPRNGKTQTRGLFYGNDGEGKSRNNDTLGTVGKDDGFPTTRGLGGTRHRTKKENHRGKPSDSGHDTVHEKIGGDTNQGLKDIRIIKKTPNNYRVSFTLHRDISEGHVEIVAVGENGKANKLAISDAKGIANCNAIKRSSLGIDFDSMIGNEKVIMEFSLFDSRDYAMEVNVYEHN